MPVDVVVLMTFKRPFIQDLQLASFSRTSVICCKPMLRLSIFLSSLSKLSWKPVCPLDNREFEACFKSREGAESFG